MGTRDFYNPNLDRGYNGKINEIGKLYDEMAAGIHGDSASRFSLLYPSAIENSLLDIMGESSSRRRKRRTKASLRLQVRVQTIATTELLQMIGPWCSTWPGFVFQWHTL